MTDRLAAVVLAGGASRRMGRDKATMPCPGSDGLTMVEHTVAVLASRCAPVFVIAGPGQPLPAVEAEVLRDDIAGLGPLSATGRGLAAAAAAGAGRAFVSAVDMPYLTGELVDQLAVYPAAEIVLPWDGRDHYLAGVYHTALAGVIHDLVAMGRRSMRAIVEEVEAVQRVPMSSRALTNLNTPECLG